MNLIKFTPARWFGNEDNDKSLAVRRRLNTPREDFRSEIDRVFDTFFAPFGSLMNPSLGGGLAGETALKPRLDLKACDKEYTVAVELPGVAEKDISIEIGKNMLTISGEKKRESDDKDDQGMVHVERSYGYFQRALSLPEDSDLEAVKANFDNGVLRVTIPRVEQKKETRTIEISKS